MTQLYCYPMCYCPPNSNAARQIHTIPSFAIYPSSIRQYPEVDPTLLEQSAKSMQKLMKEASLVLNKLADSKDFATKVMSAAQQSNKQEVDKLIQSTGIKSKVNTTFSPDGINMKLSSAIGGAECCYLTIALRWL
ncbi:hypothetical protein [Metabacillus endolithicus]|uniref:Uncharacterized protein n=1 Tax=Metabacillus endolithicus TaxID=1535204 RepID=A0ABW5BZR1_9BACI|nr:hypothetical protein [Metabacillus endolithicus]UPG64120.1 hypothetical protein MVE64_03030 [Metabacillus endolithicus]